MDRDELIAQHPVLFHMAEDGTWPSIREHGLLSTAALVELYQLPDDLRREVLDGVRRSSITLHHPDLPPAVVRDQAPLKFLSSCLLDGVTPQQFLDALNERVFFWVSQGRLQRLLGARLYRNRAHVILHVDTASLVSAHGDTIELAPYNTGDLHVPTLPRRGPQTFVPLDRYPDREWRTKRGSGGEAVVELTIPWKVADIERHVMRVERRLGPEILEVSYAR